MLRYSITIYWILLWPMCHIGAQTTAHPLKDRLSLSGYVKYLPSASFVRPDTIYTHNYLHNRINTALELSGAWMLKADLRNQIFFGETVSNTPGFAQLIKPAEATLKLSRTILDKHSIVFQSTIDRLYLDFQGEKWELQIGRQRINWGINLAWNANDLFNAYNLVDFDYQERPGTDAIRVQYYTGDFSHIELAVQPAGEWNASILAGRYKFHYKSYDLQIIAGQYRRDFVLGTGWAGNIKNAGFKGECSYFRDRAKWRDHSGSLSASLSVDYTFKKGLYANASFLYNGLGSPSGKPFDVASWLNGRLSAKNLMPSKYSYLIQLSHTVNPALRASLTGIYGQGPGFLFLMPMIEYEIKSDWSLNFIGQVLLSGFGNKIEDRGNTLYMQLWYSF